MKRLGKSRQMLDCILAAAIGILLFSGGSLYGQRRLDARITQFQVKLERTPKYADSKESSKRNWARFTVRYDITGVSWVNELEIKWTVLTLDESKKPIVLQQSVIYEDVEEGRNHFGCVYLKPSFSKRYQGKASLDTTSYSVYIELLVNGTRVASHEDKKHGSLPRNWYRQADNARTLPGQLLPKSKTPFAPLDYDFYEHEKIE